MSLRILMVVSPKKLAFRFLALTALTIWLAVPDSVQAQTSQVKIVRILGQAEILSAGTWREAKTDEFVQPGDTVRLVGDGQVELITEDEMIETTMKGETAVRYDGLVNPGSRPWKDGLPFAPVSQLEEGVGQKIPQFTVPYGETDVVVVPGQPLRVITPLIAAAVRGTRFALTVALDGTSSLSTIEGEVLAVSRAGAVQMIGAGGGMQVTSGQFAQFLQQSGLNVPGGDWQAVDLNALERVDLQTLGDVNPAAGQPAAEAGSGGATASSGATTSASTTSTASTASTASTTASGATAGGTGAAGSSVVGAAVQAAPVVGPAGAMGGAGVATGALGGQEGLEVVPVDNVGALPGYLRIIDPATGLPVDDFVTDGSGRFDMGVVPDTTHPQKEVVITVGDQDYLIDLDKSGGVSSLEVSFDLWDFSTTLPYKSTATITPIFDGLTPTGSVTWTKVGIQNPSEPWWLRGPNDYNGLIWGDTITYADSAWDTNDIVGSYGSPAHTVQLTDMVGSSPSLQVSFGLEA
jgi:hypothetical protein